MAALIPGAGLVAFNAGSSSLRHASYRLDDDCRPVAWQHGTADPGRADSVVEMLVEQGAFAGVAAVGHRIVHGMVHVEPAVIDAPLRAELAGLSRIAPAHLPTALGLVDAVARRFPELPQVACFDTAFHRTIPRVAQLLPIPRRYAALGVRRYGFHGLSCEYLMAELARRDGALARRRVVLAHLGHGVSVTAVANGQSVDTSMGFTPNSGVPMSNRSGDLEPGLVGYLARTDGMTAEQFDAMVSRESGLLGVAESTGDMRELLRLEANDPRAADAVQLFCRQVKKWIGAMAAVLGGVDALVFAGGIGEHAPSVRARICDGLGHLGIVLSERANAAAAPLLSPPSAEAQVHLIATDEQAVIAATVVRVLADQP